MGSLCSIYSQIALIMNFISEYSRTCCLLEGTNHLVPSGSAVSSNLTILPPVLLLTTKVVIKKNREWPVSLLF